MTDRTYPTAAEAREAAFRIGAEGGCRADALRRAIERAQQAAVREALVKLPCSAPGHAVYCAQQDAERALDALEEAR